MPTCINLAERFGNRFKIDFDPAYNPKGRRRNNLDPWCMIIPCERGHIFPHGDDVLAIELEKHPGIARRVGKLGCTSLHQEGDDFACFLFDASDFDLVAAIVKPKRRRRVSEANREAARQRMLKFHQRSHLQDVCAVR